jgi:hypothetical protein
LRSVRRAWLSLSLMSVSASMHAMAALAPATDAPANEQLNHYPWCRLGSVQFGS